MDYLRELSELYTVAGPTGRRMLIARALQSNELEKFIDMHKDGWTGVAGDFARVMARVVQAI
jgi:hypothetical protein